MWEKPYCRDVLKIEIFRKKYFWFRTHVCKIKMVISAKSKAMCDLSKTIHTKAEEGLELLAKISPMIRASNALNKNIMNLK